MKQNKITFDRSFLKQLTTEELDKMLQTELQKEAIDEALVRRILAVLEEREADYPVEINDEISVAVEKYKASLDGVEPELRKPVRKWSGLIKAASVLLVVGVLAFAVPQAVNAENIFVVLTSWTDSVFEFFAPGEKNDRKSEYVFVTDHPGLQQIYDAVLERGITEPVVPMWVPDEYVLDEVKVVEEPSEIAIYANMKCGGHKIFISISIQDESPLISHIKDTNNVELFEVNGIEHYIVSNNENVNATWIIKEIECSVVTDCQEDIYKILKSIYTTEVQ